MRILIILGILLMPIITFSQTIIVKDKENDKVIKSAYAFGNDVKNFQRANEKGEINLRKFKNIEFINFMSSGYKKVSVKLDDLIDGQTIYLETTLFELDEIVLSANKWEQKKLDLSSRVETINREELNFKNPQTGADLIGQTDYVYIQKSQMGGGSPMIRGMATKRILLVVDGVRMNNAIFRSGNLQNSILIDANAVENFEVLFGPGSVMYGSDAIGGVMDFHTLSPKFNNDGWKVNGNLMVRTNTANFEKTGHFDLNIANDKLAFVTSFSMSDYDNMIMGGSGSDETKKFERVEYQTRINGKDTVLKNPNPKEQVNSAYSQLNFIQKVKYKASDFTDIEAAFHISQSSDIPRYDRLIRYKDGKLRDARWDYGPQKWSMSSLKVTNYKSNSFFDLMKFIVAYQTFEESRISRGFGKSDEETTTENVGAISLNLDFDKDFDKLNIGYGAEYVRNDVQSKARNLNIDTKDISPAPTRYPDGSDWTSMAAYFNGRYNFSEKFLINFGVRYTQFLINAKFDTTMFAVPFQTANLNNGSFSGSLGAVYKFNQQFHSFVNFSSGFRSPNIDDIGKITEPQKEGAVVVPNPNLTSEVAYNGEVGVAGLISDYFYFDVTTYYTILKNAMSERDFTLNGQDSIMYRGELKLVRAIQNLDEAYIYGIQAGVKVKLPYNLELNSKINYQHGEEYDGVSWTPLRHSAPLFGSTKLNWKYSKYEASIFLYYNGGFTHSELAVSELDKPQLYALDKNGNTFYESWYTLNLRFAANIFDNATIFIGLENLLDHRYIMYSSAIAAPGRSINCSIRYGF